MVKQFEIDGLGHVKVYKRRGSRSLRLSVAHSGQIRVSVPYWTPYSAGLAFARSKKTWILAEQQKRRTSPLSHGQAIGKTYQLNFATSAVFAQPKARLKSTRITVSYPLNLSPDHADVQKAAQRGVLRALRAEAEELLPRRLSSLARAHQLNYKSVSVRQLKSRWGSCDSHKNIVLSLFLMQLPWELIDYVLLHELVHTEVLRHGRPFWAKMLELEPHTKDLRGRIKTFQPNLGGQTALF